MDSVINTHSGCMTKNNDPTLPMTSTEEKCQWIYDMSLANGATEYRALESVRNYLADKVRDQMTATTKAA